MPKKVMPKGKRSPGVPASPPADAGPSLPKKAKKAPKKKEDALGNYLPYIYVIVIVNVVIDYVLYKCLYLIIKHMIYIIINLIICYIY